jgi:hypothetical protein
MYFVFNTMINKDTEFPYTVCICHTYILFIFSFETLCSRLVAMEERYNLDDELAHSTAAGRLLLTEEEWAA